MRATKRLTAEQRADRWLNRHCFDFLPPSAAAKGLLTRRLTVRRRHLWISLPPGLIFAFVIALAAVRIAIDPWEDLFNYGGLTRHQAIQLELSVAVFLVIVTSLWTQELDRRADVRIARQLTPRLARGEDIPLLTILGPRATRYATLALIGNLLIAVALMAATQGWKPWFHLAAFILTHVATALGIRRAANRPTVAVDRESLVIDERMRFHEALTATSALTMFSLLELPGIYLDLSIGLGLLVGFIQVILGIMHLTAQTTPPWQRSWPAGVTTAPAETRDAAL